MSEYYWVFIIAGLVASYFAFEAIVWVMAKTRTIRKYYILVKLFFFDKTMFSVAYSVNQEMRRLGYSWNRNKAIRFEEESTLYKLRKVENNLYEAEISCRLPVSFRVQEQLGLVCSKIEKNQGLGEMACGFDKPNALVLRVRPNALPPGKTLSHQDILDDDTHANWQ